MCITTTTTQSDPNNNKKNSTKGYQGKKFVGGNSSLGGKISMFPQEMQYINLLIPSRQLRITQGKYTPMEEIFGL